MRSYDIHSLPLAVELKPDHIQSLSFGNSLLAGSVFENARQTLQSGARVLDYAITTSIFYGIEIPLVAYLTGVVKNKDGNPNLSHPKNLIYIAPLATIPALFAAGELFHSRTKFSRYLSNGTQKSLDTVDAIDGLRIKGGLSDILRNDEEEKLGLFCFPHDITWDKDMVPHLARFIADHLVVFDTSLKRNGKLIAPKEIESAQKGMLSMEYQRLADLAQEQYKPEEMRSVRDKLKKPLK